VSVMTRVRWADVDESAIREQLGRILHSVPFQHSRRRQKFLEFLVNQALAGRSVRGYDVALEVFGRPETFDPTIDPVVRVEAGRLREKLREYYDIAGKDDPIHIDLPKGTYTPEIGVRRCDEVPLTVPSVAVLPFDDMSGEGNLGYLGDGVAEDIITALSRFPDVVVVARGSSFAYKGKSVDLRQLGRDLDVGYVVEGSVRKDSAKLRIVAQLIDTTHGDHVWAERFDRSGADPWALQDEITGMIVSALTGEHGALKQAQHRSAWKKATTSLEEYDYYLRGHDQLMRYTKEGIERAGEIWREGLTKFRNSPLLNVKLAWHHFVRAANLVSADPSVDIQRASELVREVLAAPHLSTQVARLANWLRAQLLVHERDFDGALEAVEKAIAFAPHDTFMLSSLMMVLIQADRIDQALQWADQISARDPRLGWFYNHRRGWAYLVSGRLAEAVQAFEQTELNDAHLLLAIAYTRLGRVDEASGELSKLMRRHPGVTAETWRRAYSFQETAILDLCCRDLGRAGLPEATAIDNSADLN
jgi:TolB-like protein/tetratricopeptide (TPR) repeat protein